MVFFPFPCILPVLASMIAELPFKFMVPGRTSKGGPGASAGDGDDEAVLEAVVDAVGEPGIDAPAEDPKFIAVGSTLLIASGEEAPQRLVRDRTKDQAYKDAMRIYSCLRVYSCL